MGFPIGWTDLDADDLEFCSWAKEPFSEDKFDIGSEKKRANRIKGLGNAQVPSQAVLAWNLLSQMI